MKPGPRTTGRPATKAAAAATGPQHRRKSSRCTKAAIIEEVPLDGMRKTIAARLTEAKQTIPHFYLRRDIKLDALLKFRSQLNKQLEGRGVKLSVNDFIIKACALALQARCPTPTPSGRATGCCA
jgi:pyruvate dehydrogenase E2 component (dihydrolipoamide acetyltransferase)